MSSTRWQDDFSRAPLWFIQLGSGSTTHPRGLAPLWRADNGVDWLIREIRRAYAFGARRFLCNRPVGDNGPNVPNVGASWLTMAPERRAELVTKLADLMMEHPEIEIYWHVGSDLADPREFTSGLAGRDRDPHGTEFYTLGDSSTDARRFGTNATMGGWIGTGAAGLSLDYTSQPFKRDHMVALFESLRRGPFRFTVIGEAVPRVGSGKDWSPDEPALSLMPWITTTSNFHETFKVLPTFDRENTRIIGWFEGSGESFGTPRERVAKVHAEIERGLIPAVCDEYMFRAANQITRMRGEL